MKVRGPIISDFPKGLVPPAIPYQMMVAPGQVIPAITVASQLQETKSKSFRLLFFHSLLYKLNCVTFDS